MTTQNMQPLREELIQAIIEDEREYCFDKDYCDDETWKQDNPNETREQAYTKVVKWVSEASIEELKEVYGNKYDYIFNKHKQK